MDGSMRRRLDSELVRRGLVETLDDARQAIADNRVLVSGSFALTESRQVLGAESIALRQPAPRFVSRAGAKLDAALDRFGVHVSGRNTLDVGASTGGFTDCLLQRGAGEVVCMDVGYGQLHERLRTDPRVRVMDRTNIRTVSPEEVDGAPFDLVVADVSFISLTRVVPIILGPLAASSADVVLLVKPQFEALRQEVTEGRGIIRDSVIWRRVLEEIISAIDQSGARSCGGMASPLPGSEGNVEFLLHARAHLGWAPAQVDLGAVVDEGVELVS
jgi:23S rRNA (cytidine1920-2'-O)/16S rRNA (cytidine1409-2'-O)-methyltransferase